MGMYRYCQHQLFQIVYSINIKKNKKNFGLIILVKSYKSKNCQIKTNLILQISKLNFISLQASVVCRMCLQSLMLLLGRVLCASLRLCSQMFACRKPAKFKNVIMKFQQCSFFLLEVTFLSFVGFHSYSSPAPFFTSQCQVDLTIICIYNLLFWRMWTVEEQENVWQF